mgnify:CR=1 FL=1
MCLFSSIKYIYLIVGAAKNCMLINSLSEVWNTLGFSLIVSVRLGITGTNLYKALTASKAKVYTWEDNNKSLSNIQKNINLTNFKFNQLDYCVPSPGIVTVGLNAHPVISLLKKNSIKIIYNAIQFILT